MEFGSIASGSSGNCLMIGNDDQTFLIDAGISGKKIEEGLNAYGRTTRDVDAIFVTHEHSDHIKGIGVLARRYGIKIYATAGTINTMKEMQYLGKISDDLYQVIVPGESIELGDMKISPFKISHDAAEPCGYRFDDGEKSFAQLTDTGIFNDEIMNNLKNLDVMLVESNHDLRMLQVGSYPYYLKRRIMGEKGHLSNEDCGRMLNELLHDDIKHVYLGHLSHENNYEDLAFETVSQEITLGNCPYKADDFNISIAHRDRPSERIVF